MKSVVLIGSEWSEGSSATKSLTEQVCTKLGYPFKYNDVEVCEESLRFMWSNNLKTLPVLMSLNTEYGHATRLKVGGFDHEGIVSFLSDENDAHLISIDECED